MPSETRQYRRPRLYVTQPRADGSGGFVLKGESAVKSLMLKWVRVSHELTRLLDLILTLSVANS